jgi:hypothetical protein
MGKLLLFACLVAMLIGAVWVSYTTWTSIEGPPMPTQGYIAMWLGIVFSFLVGTGLMGLVFYSSRKGYDERAHEGRVEDRE